MLTKIEIAEGLVNKTRFGIHQDSRKAKLSLASFILDEDRAIVVNRRSR